MGQFFSKRSSISITNQQTFPPLILSIPYEFIIVVVSFMDKHSELPPAKTWKTLYGHYKLYYKEKTVVVQCTPKREYDYFWDSIRTLQLFHGCLRLKFSSTWWDSETSNYPIKILCLNQEYDVPKELDYLSTDAPILTSELDYNELTASLKIFTKLKSLSPQCWFQR
jgi:hypothetical protein